MRLDDLLRASPSREDDVVRVEEGGHAVANHDVGIVGFEKGRVGRVQIHVGKAVGQEGVGHDEVGVRARGDRSAILDVRAVPVDFKLGAVGGGDARGTEWR